MDSWLLNSSPIAGGFYLVPTRGSVRRRETRIQSLTTLATREDVAYGIDRRIRLVRGRAKCVRSTEAMIVEARPMTLARGTQPK